MPGLALASWHASAVPAYHLVLVILSGQPAHACEVNGWDPDQCLAETVAEIVAVATSELPQK